MITPLDSRVLDANSAALGVDVLTLMGNAGTAVAGVIDDRYAGRKVAFACGKGNNGGDGFAAAGRVTRVDASVLLIEPAAAIVGEAPLHYLDRLECEIVAFNPDVLGDFDLIVDCALGTGLTGELRKPYAAYVDALAGFPGEIVSIDVPSGLGTDRAVRPGLTIALHDIKTGMDKDNSGEIVIMDIGIPAAAADLVGPGDMLRYPVPRPDYHKGCSGALLIIGGGPYFGAPALSAMAAMRSGVDLVRIAAPSACCPVIAAMSPVLTFEPLDGDMLHPRHVARLLEISDAFDAVLIGPGLGDDRETAEAVRRFVGSCSIPTVIDADGLNALGTGCHIGREAVLTPHAREFARLGGGPGHGPAEGVAELAGRMGATILLKGAADIISDGERVRSNLAGNPGMTTAGTGDVLAGIVAGLVAKGMGAFDAACLGAYISGTAGDAAYSDLSYGLIATDVIDRIPGVLRERLR